MTIPEKLKIGAKVYGVEITNKLDLGNVNYSGEISYTDLRYAVADYNNRRCGKDYRIVVLKSVEVKRVIDYDCEEGYA